VAEEAALAAVASMGGWAAEGAKAAGEGIG
jgi:hypothetical protein